MKTNKFVTKEIQNIKNFEIKPRKEAWSKLETQLQKKRRAENWMNFSIGIAAVFLVLIGIIGIVLHQQSKSINVISQKLDNIENINHSKSILKKDSITQNNSSEKKIIAGNHTKNNKSQSTLFQKVRIKNKLKISYNKKPKKSDSLPITTSANSTNTKDTVQLYYAQQREKYGLILIRKKSN